MLFTLFLSYCQCVTYGVEYSNKLRISEKKGHVRQIVNIYKESTTVIPAFKIDGHRVNFANGCSPHNFYDLWKLFEMTPQQIYAKHNALLNEENIIPNYERKMDASTLNGLFLNLVNRYPIDAKLIITSPTYYDQERRHQLYTAFKHGGMEVLEVVPESTCIMADYISSSLPGEDIYLVINMRGYNTSFSFYRTNKPEKKTKESTENNATNEETSEKNTKPDDISIENIHHSYINDLSDELFKERVYFAIRECINEKLKQAGRKEKIDFHPRFLNDEVGEFDWYCDLSKFYRTVVEGLAYKLNVICDKKGIEFYDWKSGAKRYVVEELEIPATKISLKVDIVLKEKIDEIASRLGIEKYTTLVFGEFFRYEVLDYLFKDFDVDKKYLTEDSIAYGASLIEEYCVTDSFIYKPVVDHPKNPIYEMLNVYIKMDNYKNKYAELIHIKEDKIEELKSMVTNNYKEVLSFVKKFEELQAHNAFIEEEIRTRSEGVNGLSYAIEDIKKCKDKKVKKLIKKILDETEEWYKNNKDNNEILYSAFLDKKLHLTSMFKAYERRVSRERESKKKALEEKKKKEEEEKKKKEEEEEAKKKVEEGIDNGEEENKKEEEKNDNKEEKVVNNEKDITDEGKEVDELNKNGEDINNDIIGEGDNINRGMFDTIKDKIKEKLHLDGNEPEEENKEEL
ncbi:hypothetical protein TCON_0372 [Astathelohania contejeani]|uniref:Uncharacterized protein n=1 Tax=Astathelohania contejeani TaxID=164912 RepID=A0ABQ7I1T8_9MICR|nr:hypothetical protein TCON_0372 [Thelohania contejeani]